MIRIQLIQRTRVESLIFKQKWNIMTVDIKFYTRLNSTPQLTCCFIWFYLSKSYPQSLIDHDRKIDARRINAINLIFYSSFWGAGSTFIYYNQFSSNIFTTYAGVVRVTTYFILNINESWVGQRELWDKSCSGNVCSPVVEWYKQRKQRLSLVWCSVKCPRTLYYPTVQKWQKRHHTTGLEPRSAAMFKPKLEPVHSASSSLVRYHRN